MAGTDSDGRAATTLLTDWLRYLLGNARHRPITAQDLVFRDLYALVAEHGRTRVPLSELYDEIRRFADVPADVALGLHATIDAVAAEDPMFAVQLEELLHVLRPLTPDEPPAPQGGYFDPGLVPPVLGAGDDTDHPYFATAPTADPTIPVSVYLPHATDRVEVETAVMTLLAAADAEVSPDTSRAGDVRTLHALPATDEATTIATCLRNLGPVIAALRSHDQAVLRAGAILVVKLGSRLTVQELSRAQQSHLDEHPDLITAPPELLAALEPDGGFTRPA